MSKITQAETIGTIWRRGNGLVIVRNGPFPDRCVCCNEPAHGLSVRRTYCWHHPAFYFLLLLPPFSLLAYLIVAALVRKDSRAYVPLCPAHRRRRLTWIFVCIISFMAGIAGIFNSVVSSASGAALAIGLASALLVVSSIVGISRISPILRPTRIDEDFACFTGAGPAFLAELPAWPLSES